ncbi:MAG: uracil-DNA glycosylase [Candidatus Fimisoma sp.]|nr:uracil-DNA glycosylase [Bacillota bacterium]MDD7284542.1 uracil-DNA glycosylase [Bacillota bacterium]MDY4747595.1 uracil-DNA glycosylase [Candidatus Fimisoma sp.]
MIQIGNDWDAVLKEENGKEYFMKLQEFLAEERQTHMVYPPEKDVFNALKYSSLADTKVVIFGQDPYHEPGQAHGMCFSVNKGIAVPPSLINIYKEIETDLGIKPPSHGYLADWAGQGVLLLNTVLTVRRGEANSHRGKGWETFTDRVTEALNEREKPMVFILWGANAREKAKLITNKEHMIITGAHPSPLSAWKGFFGGRYFSKANRFLEITGQTPINWELK